MYYRGLLEEEEGTQKCCAVRRTQLVRGWQLSSASVGSLDGRSVGAAGRWFGVRGEERSNDTTGCSNGY